MAVGEPAQRAPTIKASYIETLLLAEKHRRWSSPPMLVYRRRLWHAFGESSSVREKKSFGQSSQSEGCSSNMAFLERLRELMGLKSQAEGGSGSNIAPPLKGAKARTASLCATRSSSGHEVWLEGM